MKASYTGIVLTPSSRQTLLSFVAQQMNLGFIDIPNYDKWEVITHHVTLNLGNFDQNLNSINILNKSFNFEANSWANDNLVAAVGVNLPNNINSMNIKPHITIAVNRLSGGKPKMSNNLKNWSMLETPIILSGVVQEVI